MSQKIKDKTHNYVAQVNPTLYTRRHSKWQQTEHAEKNKTKAYKEQTYPYISCHSLPIYKYRQYNLTRYDNFLLLSHPSYIYFNENTNSHKKKSKFYLFS